MRAVEQSGSAMQIQVAAEHETMVSGAVFQVTSDLQGSTLDFCRMHESSSQVHCISLSPSCVEIRAMRACLHPMEHLLVIPCTKSSHMAWYCFSAEPQPAL